jgi:large subunit ribosomal protein L16
MLQPVRTKFRKAFKGRINGNSSRGVVLNYGAYGIKALQPERIIGKQIEAARVALTRYMKRTGRVWTRIFPNIPVSKKPTEVRMGKGKGNIEYYACRVKPGRIIFEVDGVTEEVARIALYKASAKLPIKTKFIKR